MWRKKNHPKKSPPRIKGKAFHWSHVSRIEAGFAKPGAGGERVSKDMHFCRRAGCNFVGFLAQDLL